MKLPSWYGVNYPTFADLERMASSMGVRIGHAETPIGIYLPCFRGVPVIILPFDAPPLEMTWLLAHELAHAVLHTGAKNEWSYSKGEAQANRWAARALIPEARIHAYANASLDAFIGALSAHYEDLPLEDCPARRLAAKIATYRLRALEEVA